MDTGFHQGEEEHDAGIGFYEAETAVGAVPGWARWFVEVGRNFPSRDTDSTQHLLMVTTPCDSPAAGLVALGILMRDLARESATDEARHAASIRAWARQYLEHCRDCRYKCSPTLTGCGFSSPSDGVVRALPRRAGGRNARFNTHAVDGDQLILVDGNGCRDYYSPGDARQNALHLPGRPPLLAQNKPGISGGSLSLVVPCWRPIDTNLARTYSGSCLVGRRAGHTATRDFLRHWGFTFGDHQFPLADMLTIVGWGEDCVSRLRYANPRGGNCQLDREGPAPDTAIVDGATELSDAFGSESLRSASMVGVVPRDTTPDKVERLGHALHDLRVASVESYPDFLPPPPPGVTVAHRVRMQ